MDTIYYVDSGTVIQKDTAPDGSESFGDTGISSNLPDGTASQDPYALQGDGYGAASAGGGGQQQQQSNAYVTDHFYYVDSGHIIEKTVYSDGNVDYADTGSSSAYGDGSAAPDISSLVNAPQNVQTDNGYSPAASDPYNTQQAPANNNGGGGFQQPNYVGGYGPYATPDPPQLRDQGTYVDGGRLIHEQTDQYGNSYYTDAGPASSPAPRAAAAPAPRPAPTIAPRQVGAQPSLYGAPPAPGPASTYLASAPANQPRARDGQSLADQTAITRTMFGAVYGADAGAQWAAQHDAGLGAPSAPTPATTTHAPTVAGPNQGPTRATAITGPRVIGGPTSPTTAAIAVGGNPTQFGHQVVSWLTASDFIGGVPNGLLVAGGAIGVQMLRRRR